MRVRRWGGNRKGKGDNGKSEGIGDGEEKRRGGKEIPAEETSGGKERREE